MKTNETIHKFIEKNIQPEKIFHLGTMCHDSDRWPDDVEDSFQQDFDEIFEALGIDAPEEPDDFDEIYMLCEHLTLNRKHGFLVQFATPVIKFLSEKSFASGWHYYTQEWIYAETYEQACEKAIAWAEERYEQEKAEYKKKQEAV
jgi:hypothetical protein